MCLTAEIMHTVYVLLIVTRQWDLSTTTHLTDIRTDLITNRGVFMK